MSGTIGISCTTQNRQQNKNIYFKAIDVLETTYSSVKLSYLTNLDKPVNSVNVKTLKEPQPKFTYTAGPFYVTCKSDTNFEYRDNTLIINEECTEIEISNKDITTPAECSISINNPSVKIILNGVNIKNTLERDAIYASQYRKTIDINLHIKENTTNTIESINTGIYLEDTSGGVITGNFLISGDNNDNAKLEIKGNNNYNAILSTAANIKISGGNISIKKVDTIKDLIITGGKTLFKTNTSGLGSYSWSVGGNITIDNAVAVFEAMEPFGKYSLDNTRSSSNITIGKSAVVSGANAFYDATKRCNAGFSTCNTGIEMNKYTILEDGTIFVKEDVEYWQPDGAGEGFIGKYTKMRFKKINLSTGFGLTNNGTIEIQGADVITGASGRLINNGTIDNYGEIGEVSTYGFGLENNGVINNYNEAKLYVLENITGSGNINQIATTPETTLILSGQEGVDWIQEANRYLIKNTCNEITISGSSNKNIEAEEGENDLTINLNGINAPTTQIRTNRTTTVFIKENSTNNLKSIILNGNFENKRTITLSGDNDVNCTLNVSSIIVNTFSNIEINNGIINASSIIGAEGLGNIGKVVLNGGIVNTDQFGGSNDGRTENGITINNGILYTNILGCSGGDGDTSDVKFLGGVVRFNYWESYRLSEISNSAVIITPTQSIFDTLKSKNKGLLILSEQFTSIDSLKVFDINNETGKIIIKEPLTIQHGSNMTINKDCKIIANNLYLQDANGNIETYAPEPVLYDNSILINNGELTISPGTKLYINCFDKYYLEHENNGIIYNLGEIDGKEYLKGTGRIIELELTAEVNGELYNDITVDKINRTVTIDSLTPETDYDINLIASLEPYIGRSKTIKQRTLEAPPTKLNTIDFSKKIKNINGFENVKSINFVKQKPNINGVDFSVKQDKSITAYIEKDTLIFASNGTIIIDSLRYLFKNLNNIEYIIFNNFNTENVEVFDEAFYGCTKLKELDISSLDKRKLSSMRLMFYDCSNVEKINIGSINLERVNSFNGLFDGCKKLKTIIGLDKFWNYNYTIDCSSMFNYCEQLESIDFGTESFTASGMDQMFYNCSSLKKINLKNIDSSAVDSFYSTFSGCTQLETIEGLESMSFESATNMMNTFSSCKKLKGEITINNPALDPYYAVSIFYECSIDSSSKLILNYIDESTKSIAKQLLNEKSPESNIFLYEQPATLVDGKQFNNIIKGINGIENVTDINFVYKNNTSNGASVSTQGNAVARIDGKTLYIESGGEIIANINCNNMFSQLSSIININLYNFNSSKTNSMESMFDGCLKLKNILNISNLKTNSVTNINTMFKNCESLSSILTIENKDIEQYTNVFENCAFYPTDEDFSNRKRKANNFVLNYINDETKQMAKKIIDSINVRTLVCLSEKNTLPQGIIFNKFIWHGSGRVCFRKINSLNDAKNDLNKVLESLNIDPTYFDKELLDVSLNKDETILMARAGYSGEIVILFELEEVFAHEDSERMFSSIGYAKENGAVDIDFNHLNMSKVKTAKGMFADQDGVELINDDLDFSNVETMEDMFKNCWGYYMVQSNASGLSKIDLNKWTLSEKLKNTARMFSGCKLLKIANGLNLLDVSENKDEMFKDCIILTAEMTISNTKTSYNNIFTNCSTENNSSFVLKYTNEETKKIAELMQKTKSSNSNVVLPSIMISGSAFNSIISNLTSYETEIPLSNLSFSKGEPPSNAENITDISLEKNNSILLYTLKSRGYDASLKALPPFNNIYIVSNNHIELNSDCSHMFENIGLSSLSLKNTNSSLVKNVDSMFKNSDIAYFDLRYLNTSNITNMNSMFESANEISGYIKISQKNENITFNNIFLNTTTSSNGFVICYKDKVSKNIAKKMIQTKNINERIMLGETLVTGREFNDIVSNINGFENVYEIIFEKNNVLNGVDLSQEKDGGIKANIISSKLIISSENNIMANEDSSHMFSSFGDDHYTSINTVLNKISLNNFDVSNVIDMSYMFVSCDSLTALDLNKFNTSNVVNMSYMFADCKSLTALDLSRFNTSNVVDMDSMFNGCESLITLDLSKFNTSNVVNMDEMFCECFNLSKLINKFDTKKVHSSWRMFASCKVLNTELTIMNQYSWGLSYVGMFSDCAITSGKVTVNYYPQSKQLAEYMVETKASNSNVILGTEINV